MREIGDQLLATNSELSTDHDRESLEFERGFQKLSNDIFDLSHRQGIDTLNRASIMNIGGPGPVITAPQLPVLAFMPDFLSFSMSTADIHIWKEAYYSYHRTSEFYRWSAISLRRKATNTMPIFFNGNTESCESIINTVFDEWHPLHQRQCQFFNFQQSTTLDDLEAHECLLILMNEADVDQLWSPPESADSTLYTVDYHLQSLHPISCLCLPNHNNQLLLFWLSKSLVKHHSVLVVWEDLMLLCVISVSFAFVAVSAATLSCFDWANSKLLNAYSKVFFPII